MTKVALATLWGWLGMARADDWPQWLGPQRNASSAETGLRTDWPAEGLGLQWKVSGGRGYSSIVVAGGRAFALVERGDDEVALALDAATGKELWTKRCGIAFKDSFNYQGPRSTPSVDDGRLYVQSVTGMLFCLKTDTGEVIWQHDILQDAGMGIPKFGMATSPLVEGELVIVVPGSMNACAAAYRKISGERVWTAGDEKGSLGSPVAMTVGGRRQIVFFTWNGLWGARAADGRVLWKVDWPSEEGHLTTPLVMGDRLFVTSYTVQGSAVIRLTESRKPAVVWADEGSKAVFRGCWTCPVNDGRFLYGIGGHSVSHLRCVELATGRLVWEKERFGQAMVTLADGHLFIATERGDLVLVKATPQAYVEKGRVKLMGKTGYATPAIADKRLYLRDQEDIFCLDLRPTQPELLKLPSK